MPVLTPYQKLPSVGRTTRFQTVYIAYSIPCLQGACKKVKAQLQFVHLVIVLFFYASSLQNTVAGKQN